MGLMFARRRADAHKAHAAEKQKAHAENHKKALANVEAEVKKPEVKKDADKPGAK